MKHCEDQVLKVNILSSVCYLCKKCRCLFYHKGAVERHLLKCGNETDRCISCKNNFSSERISKKNSDNNNTILTLDSESSNWQSLQCFKAINPERKPFACTVCKESFSTVENLDEHRIIHSGPFICRSCGKSFTRAWSLRRHLSTHFREGNVSCKVCRKIFFRVDNLRKHCKVHFNDFEYICGVCGEKHEKKMCYKKYTSPPENAIVNQEVLQEGDNQVGPLINVVKSKVSTELAPFGNPRTSLEKALPVKSLSLGEIENPGAFLDDATLAISSSNESTNLDVFLDDSASELSSSSGENVNPPDLGEDVLLRVSPPPDDTASTANNVEEILLHRFSPLFDLPFPRVPSIGSSHEKPTFHSENDKVNISLESETLEVSSSSTESGYEKVTSELPVLEEPSHSNEIANRQPFMEGMLDISLSEIVDQEAFLEWESLEGTLFSSEAANPGASLDYEASLKRASSSDIGKAQEIWEGASLGGPSLSGDTNQMAFLEEISQEGFLYSLETAYRENSQEGELQERTLPQNEIVVMEPSLECETNEMSSPFSGTGNSWDFLDWPLLVSPSIEGADLWSCLEDSMLESPLLSETERALLEGEPLEEPPFPYENTDPNTRNGDSATTLESSSLEIPPSPSDFISKEFSQKSTFENEFQCITEANKSSHFLENDVSQRDIDLGLPVEMYHVGIEFQCCDLSSIFDDLEMNEMGSPNQTNRNGMDMNEKSNALPPWGHAGMIILGNEVTDQIHEDEIYNGTRSYVDENSSCWDFSNGSPEDYYLDSFDMLDLY
ncbi:uncharacterized protein [Macrobrachium rosenbergii]|uniref:uncharacterized protein n=1 Tax=Macrobrachium rosenbergii TaxID=79674 RepID=UPI0034D600A9